MRHLYNYPVNLNEANSLFIRKYKNLSIHCYKLSGLSYTGDTPIEALDKFGNIRKDIVNEYMVSHLIKMIFGINMTDSVFDSYSNSEKLASPIVDELNKWLRLYFNEYIDETSIPCKNAALMLKDIINLPKFQNYLFSKGFGMLLDKIPHKYHLVHAEGLGYRYEVIPGKQPVGFENGKIVNGIINGIAVKYWFESPEDCWQRTFKDYGSFSSELCDRIKRTFDSWWSATPKILEVEE